MKSKAEKTGMSGFEFAKGGPSGMHKFTPSKTQEPGQTGPAGTDTGEFAKGGKRLGDIQRPSMTQKSA
jgi:hypothetical protein